MAKPKYVTSVKDGHLHCIVWLRKHGKGKSHYFVLPEDTDPDELQTAVKAAVEIILTGHAHLKGVDVTCEKKR